jgi:hypothetical protein
MKTLLEFLRTIRRDWKRYQNRRARDRRWVKTWREPNRNWMR